MDPRNLIEMEWNWVGWVGFGGRVDGLVVRPDVICGLVTGDLSDGSGWTAALP
jgi:hypothetical protein